MRVLGGLLFLAIPVCARSADEIEELLQRRLSPGVVALFARHKADPRIAERLKIALLDGAAPVRAVAARTTALGKLSGLLSSLKETLVRETDANAAAEEIRAFCVLGGPSADSDVLAAMRRFAPGLNGGYVRLLARLRGASATDSYFSTLRELALSPSDRRAFFRHVLDHDGPEALTAAAALAFSHRAVEDWAALLSVAAEREVPLKEGVLIAVLQGGEAAFRGEAAWYMAKNYRKHPPQNADEILEAISEERASSSDAESHFGFEILRRVLGKPAVEDESWIASLDTNPHCHLDSDFYRSSLLELLTEHERDAMFRRNQATRPPEEQRGTRRPTPAVKPSAQDTRLQLVSGLPKGISYDLLSAGGCRSTSRERFYSIADIKFDPDGLPRHVRLAVGPPRPDCRKTAEAIFLMSAAPEDEGFQAGPIACLALLDPDCLICNEVPAAPAGTEAASANEEVMRVGAKVVAPTLVKRVEPLYSEEDRRNRQEGVSLYEAIISPTGCVRNLRVLKSSHPRLDVSGMEAVARWRYKPATLDGNPCPCT